MKNFNLKKFKDYVNSYDAQRGHEDYEVKTIIDDFLYGIGLCLNEEEYEFGGGYKKFKEVLLEHLNGVDKDGIENIVKQVINNKCHCGQPVDMSNADCVTFTLCKDHATDA